MTYRDNRYPPPRDRSPPPGRFGDRRQFANRPPSPGGRDSRDAPRGPRAFDPSRDASNAPSGPRRGGLAPRGDGRDSREPPPLSDIGRRPAWRDDRDLDYERRDRDRRSPLRERSPPRRRPDSRERPFHDLDTRRPRRNSNDGPQSAGLNLSDPSRPGAPFARGGMGRSRGRGTYDPRDRGRPFPLDDRDRDRPSPRSRSRGSRTDRDGERWDDRRDDARRASMRDDRELDRFRRENPPSRIDIRHPDQKATSDISSPATPYPLSASSALHPDRAAIVDAASAQSSSARASSFNFEPSTLKEVRRDLEKGEIPTMRSETPRERPPARASSPLSSSAPQVPPQVPAFGGSFLATRPTSNVWRAPQTQQKPAASGPTSTPSAVSPPSISKTPPTGPKADSTPLAPKAQTIAVPPTGPKAERREEASVASAVPSTPNPVEVDLKAADTPLGRPQPSPASRYPALFGSTTKRLSPPSPPRANPTADVETLRGPKRQKTPTPPTAPAADRAMSFLTSAANPAPQAQAALLPASVPSGPRAAAAPSASPPGIGSNIPTGPRADREPNVVPSAPRAAGASGFGGPHREPPRGPAVRSAQWIRPGAPLYGRPSAIPAKRDAHGEERPADAAYIRRSPVFERSTSYNELAARSIAAPTARSEPDEGSARNAHGDRKSELSASQLQLQPQPQPQLALAVPAEKPDVEMSGISGSDPPTDAQSGLKALAGVAEPSSESSDDDEEMMSDMLADVHAKHDHLQAIAQARKIDLSQPQYRAITVLRKVALLHSLVADDVPFPPTTMESQAANTIPDNDSGRIRSRSKADDSVRTSSRADRYPGDLLTPKEEDDDVVMKDDDTGPRSREITKRERIERISTPVLESLPYLIKGPPSPVSDPEHVREELAADFMEGVELEVRKNATKDASREETLLSEYRERYLTWRKQAEAFEREEREEAEARDRLEREQAIGETPEPDTAAAGPVVPATAALPLPTPTEGRRSHRFASQLDLDLAIQASLESAKEDQAKQERESANVRPDPEKEATIPRMLTPEEIHVRQFYDTNQARKPQHAIEFFDFVPPVDDFTAEEHELLVAGYKADPKAWGKIAQSLPGRTYKDCINHYYQTKWTTDYKSLKDRRRKGMRSKRKILGGARSALNGLGEKEGEDQVAAVTETGRPKRLAAPTFGEKEVDSDAVGGTAKKPTMTEQSGADGKAKKQRAAKGEGKRKKAQQPSAGNKASAPSPTKVDKHPAENASVTERNHNRSLEVVESFPVVQTLGSDALASMPERQQASSNIADKANPDIAPSIEGEGLAKDKDKARGQNQNQRMGPSSYWSVQEQNDFKRYVSYYGTDFQAISLLMGTKTHIMVKNFYERKKPEMPDVIKAAEEANERRKAGLPLGEPPIPSSQFRRRLESAQPSAPRALAPNPEVAPVDHSSPAGTKASVHSSPHLQPTGTRDSRLSPPPPSLPPTSTQQARELSSQQQTPATSVLSATTRAGIPAPAYFQHAEARDDSRLATAARPYQSNPAPLQPRYEENTIGRQQERSRPHEQVQREREDQRRRDEQSRRDREAQQAESERNRYANFVRADVKREGFDRSDLGQRQANDAREANLRWTSNAASHSSPFSASSTLHRSSHAVTSAPLGPESRTEPTSLPRTYPAVERSIDARTRTPPPYQPVRSVLQQQAPPPQPPKADPPRRSNVMDLLNAPSEPQERPREHSRSTTLNAPTAAHSSAAMPVTTPTYLSGGMSSSPRASAAEVASHAQSRLGHRSVMTPLSHTGASAPTHPSIAPRDEDQRYREHRSSWPTPSSFQSGQPGHSSITHQSGHLTQPYRTASPLTSNTGQNPQATREEHKDFSGNSGHRTLLGGLNPASRVVPSPPPNAAGPSHHSRNNSLSQSLGGDSRHLQQPHSTGHTPTHGRIHTPPGGHRPTHDSSARDVGMMLHPNPYATAQQQGPDRRFQAASSPNVTHHNYAYQQSDPHPATQYQHRSRGVAGVSSILGHKQDPTELAKSRRLEEERARELQRQEDELARQERELAMQRERESQREREQKDRDLVRQREYQRQQDEQQRRFGGSSHTSYGHAHSHSATSTTVQLPQHSLAEADARALRPPFAEAGRAPAPHQQLQRDDSRGSHSSFTSSHPRYGYAPHDRGREELASVRPMQPQQAYDPGRYHRPGNDREQDDKYYRERHEQDPRQRLMGEQHNNLVEGAERRPGGQEDSEAWRRYSGESRGYLSKK